MSAIRNDLSEAARCVSTQRCLTALAGVALLAACETQNPNPQGPAREPRGPALSAAQIRRPIEDHFAQISRTVPGFAGEYIEGNDMVALVTDLADADAVRMAAAQAAATEPGLALRWANAKVRKVQYSFLELKGWRDLLFDHILGRMGAVSLDLDEVRNRVAIGVEPGSDRSLIQAQLERLGVPSGAVIFDTALEIVDDAFTEYLYDAHKPLRGGKLINYADTFGACTLGFNARWNGINVFLTSSHCTWETFENDGRQFVMDGNDTIGTEVHDPDGWTCLTGILQCRYSDAAIIRADVDTVDILYAIARPVGTPPWGIGGNGSKLIDEAVPTILVGGKRTYTLAGLGVHKIGQATGWTRGSVQQTCHDFVRWYDWKVMVCADWADYGADHGDSGSPVFTFVDGHATIAGLHVGRNTGDLAYFSSVGNLETDLGTLNVTPNGAPPPVVSVAITGPSDVGVAGTYEWQAIISNATAPYTYSWYLNSSPVGTNQTLSFYVDGSGSFTLELHTNYGDTFHYVEWTGGEPPCCEDLRAPLPKRP